MRVVTQLILIAALARSLEAQSARRPNSRQGFWIGLGAGPGSVGVDCVGCGNDRTGGFSGYVRLGGTVSRKILLGGETNGWFHSEGGVRESLGFASLVLLWYPSTAGAFFLKVGAGGMKYSADDGIDEITATAPSGSLGLGYEFRVGRMVSVAPFFNVLRSSSVSTKVNGLTLPTSDITVNLAQFGVGVTWH
jgi:hypothetical protein